MKIQIRSFSKIFGSQGVNIFRLLVIFFTFVTAFSIYEAVQSTQNKTTTVTPSKNQTTFGVNFEGYDKAVMRINQTKPQESLKPQTETSPQTEVLPQTEQPIQN